MIRVGIIGYGKMGILHGALANASNKAKIAAICDKSWIMRWGIHKMFPNVKTYADAHKMLQKTELDVVIIATPIFDHIKSALLCMEKFCNTGLAKGYGASCFPRTRAFIKFVI